MKENKNFIETGLVDLSNAYELALKHMDSARWMANLKPLKYHLESALGVVELKDLKPIQVFEVKTKLRAYLLRKGLTASYVRNQISTLNFVLRQSSLFSNIANQSSDWTHALDEALNRLEIISLSDVKKRELARARSYLCLFAKQTEIQLAEFHPEQDLKRYRKFLSEQCRLNPEGTGRKVLKASKEILKALGKDYTPDKTPIHLPAIFNEEIQRMGKYATTLLETPSNQSDIDNDPFRPVEKNPHGIKKVTWETRQTDLERYLKYCLLKNAENFNTSTLFLWLSPEPIKDYLRLAHLEKRFSAQTAETLVIRMSQMVKYAWATQARGFERLTQDEVDAICSSIWDLVVSIRKNFRPSTVTERLKLGGSMPNWVQVHEFFELALIQECKKIKKLLNQIKILQKGNAPKDRIIALEKRIAQNMRAILTASLHLYFASRPEDVRQTITLESVRKISDKYYLLHYIPSKTSGIPNPPSVDICFPPWLTPLIDFYLAKYQQKLFPGSSQFLPADQRMKVASSHVAHPDSVRRGNYSSMFRNLSCKFFGQAFNPNKMRYALTNFFDLQGFPHLYRFLGHKQSQNKSNFTKVEQNHYLRTGDGERIRLADRYYEQIQEFLKNPKELSQVISSIANNGAK